MKRLRAPKAKPGELRAQWGKLPHDNPDICYAWGAGLSKREGAFLHGVFGSKQVRLAWTDEDRRKTGGRPYYFDKTVIEELQERGYDITTLRFSIQKKVEA